ncbi:MAG TPA: FtsX-like permease family protein [Terracidiphilus sp.]
MVLQNTLQDIRYALRQLRKAPGFALRAIVTLSLGIGANAAIFMLLDSSLLRPLPFPDQGRLMRIGYVPGAQRWQIALAVIRQSLILAGAGCVAGLAGAAALSCVLHSFLFQVSATDPITFCAVPLLMVLIAFFAAWNPARRAASVDPMQALRIE